MNFKRDEIQQYFDDYINENDEFIDKSNLDDLHHDVFNTDYYIIGTYEATQWLENQVFNIIEFIKDYEINNFGEVMTDFSSPENVVNMYVYIIGESIVSDYVDEIEKELDELFTDSKKDKQANQSHQADTSGKSKQWQIQYLLDNNGGVVSLECVDWSNKITKNKGYTDNLNIAFYSKEYETFVRYEAYK